MELTRREMLKLSLLGSAALFLPLERVARTRSASDRLPESMLPTPFEVSFEVPPLARLADRDETTDYYEITMTNNRVPIIPGLPPTEVWGYNGISPGPTIVAQRGRNTVVRQINDIQSPDHLHTSVHLHGNASLPQYDGYANDTTRPGEFKDYHYPNKQNARTLWYHDHGVHVTAQNAYMGLAAMYLTHDPHEMGLPIPHGRYDVPLVIRDGLFARDGSLIFDRDERGSLFGDVILVNGKPWPSMKVERRKYRFRVLNGSISRSYGLGLSTGEPITVIGTDGGLMPQPVEADSMRLGMAERYEIVIDFEKYKVGQKVVLQNRDLKNIKNNREDKFTDQIMMFEIVSDATDTSNNEIPEVLLPVGHGGHDPMALQETQSSHTKRFEFKRHKGNWVINGKTWRDIEATDFAFVEEKCTTDEIEIWEFENKSGGWFHPIHVHLVDFKILDRNGKPPLPYEVGPKDVAYVGEGELVRVIAKFGPQKGKYMMHCHNLVHEDHDMMSQFQVGDDGPAWDSDPAKPISQMGPLKPHPSETTISEQTASKGTVPGPRGPTVPKPQPRPKSRFGRRRRKAPHAGR